MGHEAVFGTKCGHEVADVFDGRLRTVQWQYLRQSDVSTRRACDVVTVNRVLEDGAKNVEVAAHGARLELRTPEVDKRLDVWNTECPELTVIQRRQDVEPQDRLVSSASRSWRGNTPE
jgi:hypothetical protein